MEFSLPFLATDRFHYTAASMYKLFVFLGVMLILTQGGIVRRAVPRFGERSVLLAGVLVVLVGFLLTGFSPTRFWLYVGLACLGIGSGLSNPTFSALVSLYSRADQQGRLLGVFRSLGSLARGIGPLVACAIYWWQGALALYLTGALVLIVPFVFALSLPAPKE
jgi:MFS family permease